MGASAAWKLIARFAGRVMSPACVPEGRPSAGSHRGWMLSRAVGVAILTLAPCLSSGGVLSENDFKKVEAIKPLFQNLMGDLVQTLKRPDLSTGDAECINSTVRELLQISEELSSYEYLITIEKEITDFGDNSPVKGVVKFAIEKSNTILTEEATVGPIVGPLFAFAAGLRQDASCAAVHRHHHRASTHSSVFDSIPYRTPKESRLETVAFVTCSGEKIAVRREIDDFGSGIPDPVS